MHAAPQARPLEFGNPSPSTKELEDAMTTKEIAVIGAGASGLGAAFRLHQAGYHVHVFDRLGFPGGKMRTTIKDGYIIDHGPTIMPVDYTNVLAIAREAGMAGDILDAGTVMGFPGQDKIHYIDTKHLIRSGLQFNLLSLRAKLALGRLLVDAIRTRSKFNFENLSTAAEFDHESAAAYAWRRAKNREVVDYITDPLARSLVGASTAGEISAIELRFGLLKFSGSRYTVFRDGMASYAKKLAENFEMHLQTTVKSVAEDGNAVRVAWADANGAEHEDVFAGCVIAVDGNTTSQIYTDLDDERREFLTSMRYTRLINVTAAVSRSPQNQPAFWINIPETLHPGLIACNLEHNKHPNRAPAGKGLITAYASESWSNDLWDRDDAYIVEQIMAACDLVVPGVSADVEFADVHRWSPYVMRSYPGYYRDLKYFTERSNRLDRRIQLAGDYFCQASIEAATSSGLHAAASLKDVLGPGRGFAAHHRAVKPTLAAVPQQHG
jgi:oxygen-dependent protoporphyrinogen oxidase